MTTRNIEQHEIENFVQLYDNPGDQNWMNQLLRIRKRDPNVFCDRGKWEALGKSRILSIRRK